MRAHRLLRRSAAGPWAVLLAASPWSAWAQDTDAAPRHRQALGPIVVTGAREPTPLRALPAAIDTVEAAAVQADSWGVNISDALQRVPGVLALSQWLAPLRSPQRDAGLERGGTPWLACPCQHRAWDGMPPGRPAGRCAGKACCR